MVLFISDLHLCSSRPEINRIFFDFLRGPARRANSLYILGDLFEYWAGDDDLDNPFNASVAAALAECARAGTEIGVMHGNRDFLLGEVFAAACNARLIADPFTMELAGAATVLMHGDTLCTDDRDYQRFRAMVRSRAWRDDFLALPLAQRRAEIEALRRRSELEKQHKSLELMDASTAAVEAAMREHGYLRLIHGHTHRPARHEHIVDGRKCERWVLADWYRAGSYLRCDERGIEAVTLP